MSSKEIPGNNNEASGNTGSEWDILSAELQNEIQEAVEATELENETPEEKQDELEPGTADYYRAHEEEIGNLVQDLIRLRGEDSVKEGEWDNDQRTHLDGNGMPTDYAHLVRYIKDNPDSLDTLTQEYNELLAKENREWHSADTAEASTLNSAEESTGKYSEESYDEYMRKFANPFEDDELAKEIADSNPPMEGETGEEYEARIRRNAELFRTAEQEGPRDSSKESQATYNKRIAEITDARIAHENEVKSRRDEILNAPELGTMTKEIVRDENGKVVRDENGNVVRKEKFVRTALDPSRPIWGQLLDKEGRQWLQGKLSGMYPREDDESIQEWQSRVENDLGLKIWKNTPEASAKKDGKNESDPNNPDNPADPNNPDNPAGPSNGNGDGNDGNTSGKKNGGDPFPHSAAFANNPYAKWYSMNRQERQAAAEQGQAANAEQGQGESQDQPDNSETEATVNPTESQDKPQTSEKDQGNKNEKKEFGEKAKQIEENLKKLFGARWNILTRLSSIEYYQKELDNPPKGILRSYRHRKELNAKIEKAQEELKKFRAEYPQYEKALKDSYSGAKLTAYELERLRETEQNLIERAGSGSDKTTVTIDQHISRATKQYDSWSKQLEETIKNKDKSRIESHTETVKSIHHDMMFYQGIKKWQEKLGYGTVLNELEPSAAEKQKNMEQLRDEYMKAITEGYNYEKETKAEAAKLPESDRQAYINSRLEGLKNFAQKIGEAGRPLALAAAEKCPTKELAEEWKKEVKDAGAMAMFFIQNRVTDILPALTSGNIEAAKRTYDKSPNQEAKNAIEKRLKKYFGATEEFLAQLRGTDGEQEQNAA